MHPPHLSYHRHRVHLFVSLLGKIPAGRLVDPGQFEIGIGLICGSVFGRRQHPVEYLWAWLKRHAMANYCPGNLGELQSTARARLKSAQKRPSIIAACWKQATLW
jgi:hypothetical protein